MTAPSSRFEEWGPCCPFGTLSLRYSYTRQVTARARRQRNDTASPESGKRNTRLSIPSGHLRLYKKWAPVQLRTHPFSRPFPRTSVLTVLDLRVSFRSFSAIRLLHLRPGCLVNRDSAGGNVATCPSCESLLQSRCPWATK